MICQNKWANQTAQTKVFFATEADQWATAAWHSSCLGRFTSEILGTLKIMPLLIALSLRRKSEEQRNHTVTSQKTLNKETRQPWWGRNNPTDQKACAEIPFLHWILLRLSDPRGEDEEELDDNKHLPFTFFGTSSHRRLIFPWTSPCFSALLRAAVCLDSFLYD